MKSYRLRNALKLTFLITAGVCLPAQGDTPAEKPDANPSAKAAIPLEELRVFAEVFSHIKAAYVETVDDRTLLRSAIHGMLYGLDPHSAYLEIDQYQDLQETTSGEFGGLGLEVGLENGLIKVVAPIDDTPAQRAGVLAGDLIIKLDDQFIKGMNLDESVELMRGKPGTRITLTVIRQGVPQPIEIEIERAIIKVRSVKSETLEPGYGYIRIAQFQESTGVDFTSAINELKQANPKNLKGLIIDMRNNPGGILTAAIEVSSAVLDDVLIVYTEGRVPSSQSRFFAKPGDALEDIPLVVLIDGGSASASEIVAGALQDHQRAVILGTNSFGKGSVQTVLNLNNNDGLKLTTARYFTPNGRSIQALGIKPDILVKQGKLTGVTGESYFKESDLEGHLDNGNGAEQKPGKSEDADEMLRKRLAEDYQLSEALNLLKGMHLVTSMKNARKTPAGTSQ